MRLTDKSKNALLNTVFKKYLITCFIITFIIFIFSILIIEIINFLIQNFYPTLLLSYRALYVVMVAIVVWGFSILICSYRLFKQLVSYVNEIQLATSKLFDKNIKHISLSPELYEISEKVNKLKQEILHSELLTKENEKRKNELLISLAHDLKTPLSSIIGYLTFLHDELVISDDQQKKYVSIALQKSKRLETLINEFFEIARYNLSTVVLSYTEINMKTMLEQIVFEFTPMFNEKGLTCILDVKNDIKIKCDANKIQRVFDNLLRNTVLYSFPNTDITIKVTADEEYVSILCKNHADTIPEEKLMHIFDQFYRLDESRKTNAGAGVGLAIAKQIIELHQGHIFVESKNNIIQFTVKIPFL